MVSLSSKTLSPNSESIDHKWYVIDATSLHFGRLCSAVAKMLMGKNKSCYSPNVECGDNMIIVNADKVVLSGKKMTDRIYYTFSG